MTTKKVLLLVLAVAFVAFLWYKIGKAFSPGSYPFAERYSLAANQSDLNSIIAEFKESYPEFKVPEKVGLIDSADGHWYDIYFYYPEENEIVFAWTRAVGPKKTTLAFVAVNKGLKLGTWRMINRDFSQSENKEQLERFEERILQEIRKRLPPEN